MRIVICDDHLLLLQALATALAKRGFVVEAIATSPAEAVRLVALHDPDLLLLDVMFPRALGLEAARRIAADHPRTAIVMFTGSQDVEPVATALEIGVAGYLGKDQSVDAIADKLRRARQGELVVDHDLLRRLRSTPRTQPKRPGSLDELTERERQVVALLKEGQNTEAIMTQLQISKSTVRSHVQNILYKLGVHSRVQAVAALKPAGVGSGHDADH